MEGHEGKTWDDLIHEINGKMEKADVRSFEDLANEINSRP